MTNEKLATLKIKAQKDYPTFAEEIESLSVDELEKKITLYAHYREDTELAKKLDAELINAQEKVKQLIGPYNDTLKALKLKMALLNLLIKEARGELIG